MELLKWLWKKNSIEFRPNPVEYLKSHTSSIAVADGAVENVCNDGGSSTENHHE
jgi:hypothetical protein